jgi:hypothetical protein
VIANDQHDKLFDLEFCQQRLGLLQISRIKSLGECDTKVIQTRQTP